MKDDELTEENSEVIEFNSAEEGFNIFETIEKQKRKVEEMRALVIQKSFLTPQQIETEKKAEEMIANSNCEGV